MMKDTGQGEEKYVEIHTRRKVSSYHQEIKECKEASGGKVNECAEKKERPTREGIGKKIN